jgi:putative serine protease PepD
MATRQPNDAPPGIDADAAPDQPDRDRGPAAPGADAPGPDERPTERLNRAGARPQGDAAAYGTTTPVSTGPDPTTDPTERPRWVAAQPDPAQQPEARDGAPPEQPAAWGAPPGPSRWWSNSQEPLAGDAEAPHEPATAPVAGFGARPGWDSGQSGQAGPSWGAGSAEAGQGWTTGSAQPGPGGSAGSDQNGPSWGSGPRKDGPSWETAPVGSSGWGSNPAQTASFAAPPSRRSVGRTVLALVAAIGLLLTGAGLNRLASERSGATVTGGGIPVAAPAAPLPAGEEPVAAVARTLGPSVVQLEVGNGLGSGVIYDKNGYILTAAHVTAGSQTVTVRLFDGSALRGRVVGSDQGNDVAVVKVDRGGLRPANLALKSALQVGQMAVAIGSPFGLQQTVTQGVVSAKDRSLPTPDGGVLEVIQTDAPINPGNSGGALADRQGRVIGINDSIRSESGGNEGVGFAIPIDTAVASAAHIVKGEPIRTGYLGVSLNTPSLGRAGALVDDVAQGSPADQAGLKVGDLIVKVGDRPIQSSDDLAAGVRLIAPGQNAVLQVIRDGKEQTVSVTLGQRPHS